MARLAVKWRAWLLWWRGMGMALEGEKRFKVDGLLYNTSFNGAALWRHLSDSNNIRISDEPPQRTGQHLGNFLHCWNNPIVYAKKQNQNESSGHKPGIKPSAWAAVIKAGLDLISLAEITSPKFHKQTSQAAVNSASHQKPRLSRRLWLIPLVCGPQLSLKNR